MGNVSYYGPFFFNREPQNHVDDNFSFLIYKVIHLVLSIDSTNNPNNREHKMYIRRGEVPN